MGARDEVQAYLDGELDSQANYRDGSTESQLGYTRIQGALSNLGHTVNRGTIVNILKESGIDPAPERIRKRHGENFSRRIGR